MYAIFRFHIFSLLICGILANPWTCQAWQEATPDPADQQAQDVHGLRPPHDTEELIRLSREAIERGFDFLVKSQNPDGSWGSHIPKTPDLADFGFGTKNKGSNDAVRAACTAICAEALLRHTDRTPEQQQALEKAIKDLIRPVKFAYHVGESFNTWGYGYKLDFLAKLDGTPEGKPYRDEIREAAKICVEGLLTYQMHQGGWNYYGDVNRSGESMSFNTAFFVLALKRARDIGVEVPDGMIEDAINAVEIQRAGDGNYIYSTSHLTNRSIMLENLGAGSRTVACELAMYHLTKSREPELIRAMEIFYNGENYLEEGRKLIQPHSASQQISGYFFFFGYNYASEIGEILQGDVPQKNWDRFSWTMLRTQEDDGCWWDTAAASYGDKWGTGFAIMTLQRYLAEMERRGLTE